MCKTYLKTSLPHLCRMTLPLPLRATKRPGTEAIPPATTAGLPRRRRRPWRPWRPWRRSARGWAPGSRRPRPPRAPVPPRRLRPDAPRGFPKSHGELRWASQRDTHGATLEPQDPKMELRWFHDIGTTSARRVEAWCVNLPYCRLKERIETL